MQFSTSVKATLEMILGKNALAKRAPMLLSLIGTLCVAVSLPASNPHLSFAGKADNDLIVAAQRSGITCSLAASPDDAIEHAAANSAVLILADNYPEQRITVSAKSLQQAVDKNQSLYIEYPAALPGLTFDEPQPAGWQRIVVPDDTFEPTVPSLQILTAHDCRYLPLAQPAIAHPLLVMARVAGFDEAVFGLPEQRSPVLFEMPQRKLILATTKLSNFVTARYAPQQDWQRIWEHLLARLDPSLKGLSLKLDAPASSGGKQSARLVSPLVVSPTYTRDEPLPADAEARAIRRSAEWVFNSRLLLDADRARQLYKPMANNVEIAPMPPVTAPQSDGTHGILEGYTSLIHPDGSQDQRIVLRADCNAETAMCLAVDNAVSPNERSRKTAEKLLDYTFFTSEFCRGVRGNPKHPAFGLIAWGAVSPAWRIGNYGDDNARTLEAAILAAACLKSDRWDSAILRGLLANLRTTGKLGFRGDRVDIGPLERFGWKHFHDAETVHPAPHFESGLWACYLWGYARTKYPEFLQKARTAIRMTMEAYPEQWQFGNDVERARMMLALAWLVRVEDTPEHRDWLKRITVDLLVHQDPCGAIPCRIGTVGTGHFLAPTSNEQYGTGEVPLIQENGDTVSDQLYTTGFALLALHEAAAATGDKHYRDAEDKFASYACRIQIRSTRLPFLDGTWFRAFDYRRWDFWASSGDIGWGAWCLEAGWAQAWTTAALGLRARNTSMWELTATSDIACQMHAVQEQMAHNDGNPWTGPAFDPTAMLD